MNMAITLSMIAIYIAGLIYLVYRNPLPKQDFEEYAVGGRSFGWAFITMTIIGTWYAGSMYVGWAQMGVEQGIVVTYVMFYTLGGLYVLYAIAAPLHKDYGTLLRAALQIPQSQDIFRGSFSIDRISLGGYRAARRRLCNAGHLLR